MFLIIGVYTTVRMIPLKMHVCLYGTCVLENRIYLCHFVSSLPVCNCKIGRGTCKGVLWVGKLCSLSHVYSMSQELML